MGKSELFSHFADRFEVKRTQAREFFDELNTLAEKELKRSGEFVLPGMVKLVVQKRKARMGRNPATGEAIKIPGKDRREGANRQAAEGRRPAPQVASRRVARVCRMAARCSRSVRRFLIARVGRWQPLPAATRQRDERIVIPPPARMRRARCARGKSSTNVVPLPTSLATVICPPSCSTIFFEIARPSPRPRRLVVTKSSKIAASRSGGMPQPVSVDADLHALVARLAGDDDLAARARSPGSR